MALDDETQASADASRWAGRGVYVPKGMTREKITRIADALMALDGGVSAPMGSFRSLLSCYRCLGGAPSSPRTNVNLNLWADSTRWQCNATLNLFSSTDV